MSKKQKVNTSRIAWTDKETALLFTSQKSIEQLAKQLGRTEKSISGRKHYVSAHYPDWVRELNENSSKVNKKNTKQNKPIVKKQVIEQPNEEQEQSVPSLPVLVLNEKEDTSFTFEFNGLKLVFKKKPKGIGVKDNTLYVES